MPAGTTTTLQAVRTKLAPNMAAQMITREYLDSVMAGVASTVVHRDGAETITGTKQFSAPVAVPTPVGDGDAANKIYVDQAVALAAADGARTCARAGTR